MKRLLLAPLILALAAPIQAEIDPKVRKACLAAADSVSYTHLTLPTICSV